MSKFLKDMKDNIEIDLSYAMKRLDILVMKYFLTQEIYNCQGKGVTVDWNDIFKKD